MNQALAHYVDHINHRRSLFGRSPWDVYDNYAEVREEIETLGDPAILAGDGELTREETEARTNQWIDAMLALDEIGKELTA